MTARPNSVPPAATTSHLSQRGVRLFGCSLVLSFSLLGCSSGSEEQGTHRDDAGGPGASSGGVSQDVGDGGSSDGGGDAARRKPDGDSASGGAGGNVGTGGETNRGSIQDGAPPPNSLDAGDGTASTGATTVYNGKTTGTNGGQTGCSTKDDNRYNIQFSTIYPGPKKLFVLVSLPRDQIEGRRSFEVGPADDDWTGIQTASVYVFGKMVGTGQYGAEGRVWASVEEGKVEMRFQDVKLREKDGPTLTGNTVSAAYLCGEELE